ncbi:MAG: penicillin-binding protein 1C [Porphyromonadaceae bacterium]|nr:penicillin-binding protein 1C [Porphyromonadaceae bacterium]
MFKIIYHKFLSLRKWKQLVLLIGLVLLLWYVFSLPKPLFDVPYSTLVTDRNGEMLSARISSDGQWRFPKSDSLPDKYKTSVIQFEDRHFYRHPGVNPLSIGRAFLQNIRARRIVSGGSTLTMQTVRLMRKNKRTYFEKLIEIILATRLEWSFSKEEILELYAAHAPLGGNVVGVEAAAWRYFGHDVASLSWAEAATLAVLPNSPSLMHFGKNREKLISKRNRLLQKLHDNKIINEIDLELALIEPLPDHPHALPQISPHLVTQLFLKTPGERVQSTINKRLQLQADEVLTRWNAEFSQNGINNIAALIVDIQLNEVLTYSGNVHFEKQYASNQVDVIQAPRSTGSILKPFLYCAMLQEGLLLPKELIPDIPINLNGFAPKNFSLQYDGAAAADEALVRSLNVPAVVELRKYSVPKFYQFLKKTGMSTLTRTAENYGLSLILGGAEGSLWEISTGFSHMARTVNYFNSSGGKYFQKRNFTVIKSDYKVQEIHEEQPIFDVGAAWLTLEALTNVNRPEEIDREFIPSIRKVAWKTGTSYGFRDAWSIGVTPKYLVAVWTGNASGEGRPGLTGARTSAHVMFDLFNLLPSTSWFETPYKALREAEICRESGLLIGKNCPLNSTDTLLLPPKGLQGKVCDFHKIVHVSDDGKYQVYENCAGNRGIKKVSWFVLPPAWEWYYKQHNPSYVTLPPYSPECLKLAGQQLMQFIYPYPNAILKLPKQLDGSKGKAIFELAHRTPSSKVYWHLDEEYIGETTGIHQLEISPEQGNHMVTVVDEKGNSISVTFKVE